MGFFFSLTGGKTNQLILQNTATKAIIQGLIPDQNYALQIIAFSEDKESKPAQGQFRSMCLFMPDVEFIRLLNITFEIVTKSDTKGDNGKTVSSVVKG